MVGLAHVAIAGGFALGIKISVVSGACGFPDRLASIFFQGSHILLVDAVEGQNDQVFMEQWRRTWAAEVACVDVATLPDFFARSGVEAGCAVGAKVGID